MVMILTVVAYVSLTMMVMAYIEDCMHERKQVKYAFFLN